MDRDPFAALVDRVRGVLVRRPARRRGWVTPFVVTRNSAPWIVPLLDIYRHAGLEPRVILDDRSNDGTGDVLARAGYAVRRARGTAGHAEPMVAEILRDVPSGWLLRMDDDEAPSAAMLDMLTCAEPDPDAGVVGFERRSYARDPAGGLLRARYGRASPLFLGMRRDRQYRLFRAERVAFTGAIHTPGFVVPPERVHAPPEAFIGHFVWLLRTLDQRRAKLAAYEAEQAHMGTLFADMYVPEDAAPGGIRLVPDARPEFAAIAATMGAAAGHR